jgi:uncharacterized ferritin-like protein (DUF455 family)
MEFFKSIEDIILCDNPLKKIESFKKFKSDFYKKRLFFDKNFKPKTFQTPSYANFCKISPAQKMPKRSSLSTDKGKAYLLHSIAHIEYSAIDLALDHAYKFNDMPREYYEDWIEVAEDEIRHFLSLKELLNELGFEYGDFEVHSFLFDISQKSMSLSKRMATIPRYLEASGLDSNPQIIKKLQNIDDPLSKRVVKALEIILEEEVSHVKKGDKWFRYGCSVEGIDPKSYFDIVEEVLPGAKRKKPFVNVEYRQRAGFSCKEIRLLSDQECID